MKEPDNATLMQQHAGNPGCGMGTENACFALTMGPGGLQCALISSEAVAQMAGIRLSWRVNVDETDGKAWCPKGILDNSKLPLKFSPNFFVKNPQEYDY